MILCQITDGTGNLEAVSVDADLVQIREPQLSPRQLAEFIRAALKRNPNVLVNDRIDVALACGAIGAHLKGGAVGPKVVREIVPAGFLLTVACHNREEILLAEGADYLLVSPVFRPISKQDTREPLGIDGLKELIGIAPAPVLALGGITCINATKCVEAGAAGVAGISLFSGRDCDRTADTRLAVYGTLAPGRVNLETPVACASAETQALRARTLR